MRKLITKSGFSLPELLIVLALVGGISLITMKVFEEQASNEAYLKASAEIQKAVNLLKTNLSNTENCRFMLSGKTIGVDITNPLQIRFRDHAAGVWALKEIIRANQAYPGFRVDRIRLMTPVTGTPNSIDLVIDFRIKSKSIKLWSWWGWDLSPGSKDKLSQTRIPIIASLLGSTVRDCGPVVSSANEDAREKFCLSLGAIAIWTGTRCQLVTHQCAPGMIPERMEENGSIITATGCVSLLNKMDLNHLIDTSRCQNNNNRYSIVSNPATNKLMLRCH